MKAEQQGCCCRLRRWWKCPRLLFSEVSSLFSIRSVCCALMVCAQCCGWAGRGKAETCLLELRLTKSWFRELLEAYCRWGKLSRWTASKCSKSMCLGCQFSGALLNFGGLVQYAETKVFFSQDRAALWFVKVIENENLSGSGSSSQAPVLLGAAEDWESCWGCLEVRACVLFL